MRVRKRAALEHVACECYSAMRIQEPGRDDDRTDGLTLKRKSSNAPAARKPFEPGNSTH
jgi:hypothetical protein